MDTMELRDKARLYLESGDPSTAARYLAEVAGSAPDDRGVLHELAQAYYRSAALGKAETVLRRLVELDPSDGYARLLLGRALARQSRHAEALPQLRLSAALTGDADTAAEVLRTEARLG